MKISYNTLKKYISNLKTPEEVAQDLIMHTAEVEEIIHQSEELTHVFIGQITSVTKHEDSDKLNICQVEVQGETKQIVCGAANVALGLKVPVAVV
jgi:phenylalanyl-tRNA synthetase beta chain